MMFRAFHAPTVRERILSRQNLRKSGNRVALVMALTAVMLVVLIFVFFQSSAKNMENSIRSSLLHSTEQRKINMDFRLRSLMQMDENLISMIYPYMESDVDRAEQLNELDELNSILSLYAQNEYVSNVRVYVPDRKIYSTYGSLGSTFRPLSSLLESEDAEKMPFLRRGGSAWMETHPSQMIGNYNTQMVTVEVLTYVHTMRQRKDYSQTACVLMLDVEVSKFHELLDADAEEDQYGYLINGDGICLAAQDASRLRQQAVPPKVMEQLRQSESGCLKSRGRVYVYYRLDVNDWYIVMDYPARILSFTNSTQSNLLLVLVAIITFVSLSLMYMLAYNLTMNVSITRVNESLDALNRGADLPPEESSGSLDLLHNLERNADQMVLTVKELMEEQYKDRLAIAELEMKSLQAQIKPHFLYNTLDIIKWMILDQKNEDAAGMVNSLSKYLRQSINKGPNIIPLREEMELSRTYLAIMQKRFENRFQVNYEVEEGTLDCLIPKLSLQPLLENALIHGVLYCEKPDKELTLRAWESEGELHIEVEDNGNGMTKETQRAIEEGKAGYGFSNVRERLKLFSQGENQIGIFSRVGLGTCITIQIAAVRSSE